MSQLIEYDFRYFFNPLDVLLVAEIYPDFGRFETLSSLFSLFGRGKEACTDPLRSWNGVALRDHSKKRFSTAMGMVAAREERPAQLLTSLRGRQPIFLILSRKSAAEPDFLNLIIWWFGGGETPVLIPRIRPKCHT